LKVLRLARYLKARREDELEPFGVTLGHFDMLATMRRRARDSGRALCCPEAFASGSSTTSVANALLSRC
jgi:hypothetical protein